MRVMAYGMANASSFLRPTEWQYHHWRLNETPALSVHIIRLLHIILGWKLFSSQNFSLSFSIIVRVVHGCWVFIHPSDVLPRRAYLSRVIDCGYEWVSEQREAKRVWMETFSRPTAVNITAATHVINLIFPNHQFTHLRPVMISFAPMKFPIFQHVMATRSKQPNAARRSSGSSCVKMT